MRYRLPATLAVFALLLTAAHAQQPSSAAKLADLKTTAEASGYKSTSTYDDVVKFMKAVDAASPIVFYDAYGVTVNSDCGRPNEKIAPDADGGTATTTILAMLPGDR